VFALISSPAVRIGLSIAVATGLYGVSFGALAVASGLDVWQTVALSILMFTGGSQYAFIGVIGGGGTGSAAFSAAALLGDAMGDPRRWGLDGAAVAAFLGLLWPRLRAREPVALAIVCALVTVLAVPFVPPGVPILVAAFVAALWGWFSGGPAHEGLEPDIDPARYDGDDGSHGATRQTEERTQ
jgi:predicted branched-subunit amino acid permease